MSTEEIIKVHVIAYSKKRRGVTHDNAMCFEEEIADFEEKLSLTDGERVILDHIASKLQMYDSEFHQHHYRLVDCIDNVVKLELQQIIFLDHDRRMMDFFKRMTNLRSQRKIVTLPPKPAEETIYTMYLSAYNSRLQLIMSQTRITDENVD